MKGFNVLSGLVLLLLGFAIGWFAKPVTGGSGAANSSEAARPTQSALPGTSAHPPETTATRPGTRREPRVRVLPAGKSNAEQEEMGRKMQEEIGKAMVNRVRGQFDKQIERLGDALNLTPNQKRLMEESLAGEMKNLESLDFTDPNAMKDDNSTLAKLFGSGNYLEDILSPTLSADQQAALSGYKEREHRAKVDARALRSLSKLQGAVDFDEGQRDRVYEVLSSVAESSILEEKKTVDFSSVIMDGMSIDQDPYDLGLQQVMTEVMAGSVEWQTTPGEAKEKNDVTKKLREAFDKRIEAKVDQLRPVLNEKQLEQYRSELKSKGLGIYSQMLMGMEMTED